MPDNPSDAVAIQDYGWSSAEAAYSASYLYPPILSQVDRLQPARILDLGCGNGHLASVLAKRGIQVVGVDADEGGITQAQTAWPQMDYRVCNVGDAPPSDFVSAPFDMIISTEVVEHLFLPSQLFHFARQCLASNGVFLVSTPYHGWLKNSLISLSGKWDKHHHPASDGGHIKFWSRETLRELAVQAGFREKSFIGCGRFPYLWKSMLLVFEKQAT